MLSKQNPSSIKESIWQINYNSKSVRLTIKPSSNTEEYFAVYPNKMKNNKVNLEIIHYYADVINPLNDRNYSLLYYPLPLSRKNFAFAEIKQKIETKLKENKLAKINQKLIEVELKLNKTKLTKINQKLIITKLKLIETKLAEIKQKFKTKLGETELKLIETKLAEIKQKLLVEIKLPKNNNTTITNIVLSTKDQALFKAMCYFLYFKSLKGKHSFEAFEPIYEYLHQHEPANLEQAEIMLTKLTKEKHKIFSTVDKNESAFNLKKHLLEYCSYVIKKTKKLDQNWRQNISTLIYKYLSEIIKYKKPDNQEKQKYLDLNNYDLKKLDKLLENLANNTNPEVYKYKELSMLILPVIKNGKISVNDEHVKLLKEEMKNYFNDFKKLLINKSYDNMSKKARDFLCSKFGKLKANMLILSTLMKSEKDLKKIHQQLTSSIPNYCRKCYSQFKLEEMKKIITNKINSLEIKSLVGEALSNVEKNVKLYQTYLEVYKNSFKDYKEMVRFVNQSKKIKMNENKKLKKESQTKQSHLSMFKNKSLINITTKKIRLFNYDPQKEYWLSACADDDMSKTTPQQWEKSLNQKTQIVRITNCLFSEESFAALLSALNKLNNLIQITIKDSKITSKNTKVANITTQIHDDLISNIAGKRKDFYIECANLILSFQKESLSVNIHTENDKIIMQSFDYNKNQYNKNKIFDKQDGLIVTTQQNKLN